MRYPIAVRYQIAVIYPDISNRSEYPIAVKYLYEKRSDGLSVTFSLARCATRAFSIFRSASSASMFT